MPVKMNPIIDAADDVILVGDPRRAFALAQELTVKPRMSHQARGLWGYRGRTASGRDLTVQSTGSGGPGAVPVIGDLAAQGARRMLRLGTCLATGPDLKSGRVILVERALAADGAGRQLNGGGDFTRPDLDLLDALAGLGLMASVSSHDLVERHDPASGEPRDPGSPVARDLQTATTLALGRRLGLAVAALLIVVEDSAGTRLDENQLEQKFRDLGLAALERLEVFDARV